MAPDPPGLAPESAAPALAIALIDISPFLAVTEELDASRSAKRRRTCAADAQHLAAAEAEPIELTEAARAVAKQWHEAFSTQGFVQVVGHGVPDEVIEGAYAMARRFFSQSAEEKKRCDLGLGYGAGGYNSQGVERVSATASLADGSQLLGAARARPPDRVESMIVNRRPSDPLPEALDGYRGAMYSYYDEMVRLLRCILRLTAISLDMPLDHFEPYYFGEKGVGPHSYLGEGSIRQAYYPAWRDGEEPPPGQLRYGEHTDYTGFTILWQDHNSAGPQTASDGLAPPAGGLQVQMPGGTWIDCPPAPKAFTINAGDLIQVWTNDVFRSNTHRVKNPPPGDRHDRISLVYFSGPEPSTLVEALPTCCGPDRPRKYTGITSGDHLARKIAASNR